MEPFTLNDVPVTGSHGDLQAEGSPVAALPVRVGLALIGIGLVAALALGVTRRSQT